MSDLQNDLYFATQVLDSKAYTLDTRLSAIKNDCMSYSQSDTDFYEDYRDALGRLNELFQLCEVFVNNMARYLRTIAGNDPDLLLELKRKSWRIIRLENDLSTTEEKSRQFDQLFMLEKYGGAVINDGENTITVVKREALDEVSNRSKLLQSMLFNTYNALLKMAIKSSNLDDNIKSKLEKLIITADELTAKFNQDVFPTFQKEWDEVLKLATDEANPLYKYLGILQQAHTIADNYASLLGIIKRENDAIKTETLCSEYRKLVSRLVNTAPYSGHLFVDNINLASLQHHMVKLSKLNLGDWNEKEPPSFERANKIIAKIDGIFEKDKKSKELFEKDNLYQNFKTTLTQLEQKYKTTFKLDQDEFSKPSQLPQK